METKQEKKSTAKKVGNIVFYVVLAIIAIYAVIALTSDDDGVTSIFGGTGLTVQSNSMLPTFEKGDLIFVDTDFNVDDLEVDDVITYQMVIMVDGQPELIYNSHRIIDIQEDVNGNLHFFTQGDNNPEADDESISESYVLGVWNGKVYKNIGGIIDGTVGFLKSSLGFFLFIVLPCFAFLVYEVVKFIGVMSDYKTQQALGDRVKMQEEALAAARAQLEAEAKLKEDKEDKKKEQDE